MTPSPSRDQESAAGHAPSGASAEANRLTSHGVPEGISSPDSVDPQATGMIAVIQLVLAEKRTSLAVLRTGVTIALVPLSITTVLVTLSRFYDWVANLHFLVPMYGVLTGLTLLSLYLMVRAVLSIRAQDRLVDELKQRYPDLARFIY